MLPHLYYNFSKKTLFRFDKSTSNATTTSSSHHHHTSNSAAISAAVVGTVDANAGDPAKTGVPLTSTSSSSNATSAGTEQHRRSISDTPSTELQQHATQSGSLGAGANSSAVAFSARPGGFATAAGASSFGNMHLVCSPDASLVRMIYVPLICVLHEIEAMLKHKSSAPCALHTFLTAYVRDTFLANGHGRTLELTVDGLAKNQEAWRTVVSADEARALGLQRPLLQSTVLFEKRE